jgi:hypothetical protein
VEFGGKVISDHLILVKQPQGVFGIDDAGIFGKE